ncbi:hypothetical protein B0H17DRAFT_1144837 [Mycena rosella]|uniref:Uncharacterized protein n=1 Tax=Mycena rosella TaxID=1033263 RepID=A0AAD7CST0_MYCRO|nr:hypothetical protein B0H17DRAFT_1144837 [Mycena rosella]
MATGATAMKNSVGAWREARSIQVPKRDVGLPREMYITAISEPAIKLARHRWGDNVFWPHLRDRHPKWELTKSSTDREAFAAMFSISELERRNLGADRAVEVSPPSPEQSNCSNILAVESRGENCLPVSPAATPRHRRFLKISRAADGGLIGRNFFPTSGAEQPTGAESA